MIGNEKVAKSSHTKYYCDICDYETSKKTNIDKHFLTAKHNLAMIGNEKVAKVAEPNTTGYVCNLCGKVYKDNSGL